MRLASFLNGSSAVSSLLREQQRRLRVRRLSRASAPAQVFRTEVDPERKRYQSGEIPGVHDQGQGCSGARASKVTDRTVAVGTPRTGRRHRKPCKLPLLPRRRNIYLGFASTCRTVASRLSNWIGLASNSSHPVAIAFSRSLASAYADMPMIGMFYPARRRGGVAADGGGAADRGRRLAAGLADRRAPLGRGEDHRLRLRLRAGHASSPSASERARARAMSGHFFCSCSECRLLALHGGSWRCTNRLNLGPLSEHCGGKVAACVEGLCELLMWWTAPAPGDESP